MDLCLNKLASKYGRRTVSVFHTPSQPTITRSKLTIAILEQGVKYVQSEQWMTPEWRQWRRSGVFIVSFEPCVTVSARISSKQARRKSVILIYS